MTNRIGRFIVLFICGFGAIRTRAADEDSKAPLYREWLRPQFHFTARTNWLNDPNGLVFYKGEYHLLFQHNPSGINWGNMTWGHAISSDLLHWRQLDDALKPDRLGTIFSGSAVVDWDNTAGFQKGDEKTLITIFTSAGKPFTQSIAFSTDRGRNWTKYERNPVLDHIAGENRDPKVIWHAPTKHWIMALYLDGEKYALFSSPDLKRWEKLCDLPEFGATECPDFFPLPVKGKEGESKWIFWGGNGNYLIGRFDGKTFTKESGPHRFEFGNNFYAAQTYSDIPSAEGRRIQIAWMRDGKYPEMPFNQQMTIPAELTLRQTPDGPRLHRWPIRELDSLHAAHHAWNGPLTEGKNPLADIRGELFDLQTVIDPAQAKKIVLTIRGTPLEYDASKHELKLLGKSAPLAPVDGKIRLRVLIDRSSIEVFGNDGAVTMSSCFIPTRASDRPPLALDGMGANVLSLDVWEMKSCW
jgi:fructan beta-fructosidase